MFIILAHLAHGKYGRLPPRESKDSSALENKSMRAGLAKGAFVMTRASLPLTLSALAVQSEDGESALGGAEDSLRAVALIHLPPAAFPAVGQGDYGGPRGEPESRLELPSPAGCTCETERSLQNLSLDLTRVSLLEIMSHF